jgi:hypothetical protein
MHHGWKVGGVVLDRALNVLRVSVTIEDWVVVVLAVFAAAPRGYLPKMCLLYGTLR